MKRLLSAGFACAICAAATVVAMRPPQAPSPSPAWNVRAAASYLDSRQAWWLKWPNAARDHGTACVSCHTALPYALARPQLRTVLAERDLAGPERTMLDQVVTRVRLWKDVEPFYPDQTRGLPKTSESRGTEAVLNALILANRDADRAALSDEAGQAFANLWALQFTAGDQKGAWAWLNFHYEPWESTGSPYYGAALAALAAGTAPGGYASRAEVQSRLTLLRAYLQRRAETESLLNRVMVLWASTKLSDLLTADQRQAIIEAAGRTQQEDGGWTTSMLGPWKRLDGTALDSKSDGYATGLITLVLQHAGVSRDDSRVRGGLAWLAEHQDPATGRWFASSLNKQRDPASDAAKFMSDAATGFAVLGLIGHVGNSRQVGR